MKNKIRTIILSVILANICFASNEPALQKDKLALTIIVDTSWSCEKYISDFASLSRQAISSSLSTGSYIEVLSAHPGNPRIRIAQTIKSTSEEISGITAILKTIRSDFLTNATVSSALGMTFKRLEKISAQNQYGNVAVIIFSNGRLSDNDASRIVEFSEQFQKKGWLLYITGTKDTNKRVLVAANQNKLHWSFISEANPVLWLEKAKKTSLSSEKPVQLQSNSDRTSPTANEPSEQQSQSRPLERIPVTSQPLRQEDTKVPESKVSIPVKSEVPVPAPNKETTNVSVRVPETPKEPASTTVERPVTQTTKETQSSTKSVWNRLKEIPKKALLFILLPIGALAAIPLVVILRGTREARRWRMDMNSRLKKSQPNDDGVLVARLNGQSYRLGKLDSFKSIHVGSDINNTIKISDKSIEGRHLEIFKKDNQLMLRNLASSPVIANNTEVKSGQRHQLVVPSIIQLNDRIKINLELDRPKIVSNENRSNKDE